MTINTQILSKALAGLQEVMALKPDDVIRDSAIQRFEYTYELSVKLIRRILEQSESTEIVEALNYKDMIRMASEKGFVDDVEKWYKFREKRNITSHSYDEVKAKEVYSSISMYIPLVEFLIKKANAY